MNAGTKKKQLVGTTSWLVPGTYYENARLVAQSLNFVELLVYQWDRETKALFDSEKEKLISLHERYGLIYTVHLPTNDFEEVLKAYDYFERLSCKLSVVNYILHPYADQGLMNLPISLQRFRWRTLLSGILCITEQCLMWGTICSVLTWMKVSWKTSLKST